MLAPFHKLSCWTNSDSTPQFDSNEYKRRFPEQNALRLDFDKQCYSKVDGSDLPLTPLIWTGICKPHKSWTLEHLS